MHKLSFTKIILILGLIFFYTPLLVLIFFSFSNSKIVNLWGGFTIIWYKRLFNDINIIESAIRSVQIAFFSSFITTTMGTIIAYIEKRFNYFIGKNFLRAVTITPLLLPDIILGMGFMLMFSSLKKVIGWPAQYSIMTIIIAHVTISIPYVYIMMQERIGNIDKSLEEAAMDLGARPKKIFFQIILPELAPSIILSFLLVFTLSIDDLVITEFVSGNSNPTLPMYIYSTLKNGPTPKINALSTIIILIVSFLVAIVSIIRLKIEKKKKLI